MKEWLKENWDAVIAFLFIWIAPLVLLIVQGISYYQSNSNGHLKIEFAAAILLAIVLIIYFKKIKKWIERKTFASDLRGSARHPLLVVLNGIITCSSIALAWFVVKLLETFCSTIDNYLLLILIFEGVGVVFNFVHAIRAIGFNLDSNNSKDVNEDE